MSFPNPSIIITGYPKNWRITIHDKNSGKVEYFRHDAECGADLASMMQDQYPFARVGLEVKPHMGLFYTTTRQRKDNNDGGEE